MSEYFEGRLLELEEQVRDLTAMLDRLKADVPSPMLYSDIRANFARVDERFATVDSLLTVLISTSPLSGTQFRERWQSLPAIEGVYKALEDGALDPASRADLDGAEQLIRDAEVLARL